MSTPPIAYTGPTVDPEVPWRIRRHIQLIYQKLGNHTQAFQLQQEKINSLKSGTVTKVFEGGSAGGSTPSSVSVISVNNQSGITSYATTLGDNDALVIFSDASPIAVSLTTQAPPWSVFIVNQGALGSGAVTLSAQTGTINGSSTLSVLPTYAAIVCFDGSNWWALTFPVVPLSFAVISHQFLTGYNGSTGNFSASQPAFTDISGVASPSQLPTPTASTLGGIESAGPTSHEWINEIDTSGVPHLSQPAFTDISGTASTAQIGTGTPATGDYVDGGTGAWTPLPASPLSATSASIGGSAMIAGQTITTAVTVSGATTSMTAVCSPHTYPGDGCNWDAYVSSANTVTVRLTAVIALTPTASVYSVRVIP